MANQSLAKLRNKKKLAFPTFSYTDMLCSWGYVARVIIIAGSLFRCGIQAYKPSSSVLKFSSNYDSGVILCMYLCIQSHCIVFTNFWLFFCIVFVTLYFLRLIVYIFKNHRTWKLTGELCIHPALANWLM